MNHFNGRQSGNVLDQSARELNEVLYLWNETYSDYPRHKTIHELVSEQALRSPDRIALTFNGHSISFGELERRSNQLAHYLQSLGVGVETLVGLYVQRSLDMVVGVLGILKAGGAYIPIDPDFPPARIQLMLQDARPPVLVTQDDLLANLQASSFSSVCFDSDFELIASQPSDPPSSGVKPDNLAYIIYTSGSTGRPKGVQITHRAVVNLVKTLAHRPGLGSTDNMLASSTLSFDMSTVELFLPLTTGAEMTIISRDEAMDGMLLGRKLDDCGITCMQATPTTWQMMLAAGWQGKQDLKILIGGETMPRDLAAALLPRCASLWHMYGPTETTVWSTTCKIDSLEEAISIGRPIANTQIYILDDNLQPLPVGETGELCIGGDGVARGYFNRPDLNAERFVPNPFAHAHFPTSSTIYRTGDRARYLPDGRIIFLGRADLQVKIRGYRIELGDVDAAINRHPAFSQNVTIAREDKQGDRRLVTYVIPHSGKVVPPAEELREFLRHILPEYMIPARFVVLDEFPLTPNNKINRLALPAPPRSADEIGTVYEPPHTPLQTTLARFAASILNLDLVGIHDNFFDLGGNSLLATRLIAETQERFNLNISLRDFFLQPTISGLSGVIESLQGGIAAATAEISEPKDRQDALIEIEDGSALLSQSNLTRNQYLMWMGQQINPDIPLYNVIQTFTIHGLVDLQAFKRAFQTLINHHDALRTIFIEVDGVPQQQVQERMDAALDLIDFSREPNPEHAFATWLDNRKRRMLAFNKRLFDSALIQLAPDRSVWYLCQHHIITDALSEDLIFKRMSRYYALALADQLDDVPPPPQYAEYVKFEHEIRRTDAYRRDSGYWQQVSQKFFPPTEYYGKTNQASSYRTKRSVLKLGPERSASLRAIARQNNFFLSNEDLSFFTIFASLLFTTLHRINGERNLRLGTPFHGRPTVNSMEMVGLFIEMGLLEVAMDEDETFVSLIEKVTASTLSGLSHIQPGISSAAINRSYDVVLNFLQPSFTEFAGNPVTYEWVDSGFMDKDHALRLQVTDFEGSGSFSLAFDLKEDVFGEPERSWLIEHFLQIVDAFISDPAQPISAFSLLTDKQHKQLFVDFNDTDTTYPKDKTVVQLFEAQAAETPGSVAVIRGDEALTYGELNARANQLAHFLRSQGVGPGKTVAICLPRSIDVLVAIWGVLKAGGAYIPIDPGYPVDRISFMLADASPMLVIGSSHIEKNNCQIPVVDLSIQDLSGRPTANLDSPAGPLDLVYVIYTSGSTGRPKGTMLTHQGLVNYIWWARQVYQDGQTLDFPLYSSLAFDLTVTSIFVPLLSGGKVLVYGEPVHQRGLEILAVFREDAVDIVKLTPAHLALVLEAGFEVKRIRKLIVGGEDFKTNLAFAIHQMLGDEVEIYNEYGPTETVVGCMIHKYDPAIDTAVSVPIGTPAANARIYLLDTYDQPVPPGVVGEIVISSDGVSPGYLNRPQLTSARFAPDPFREGARIYYTGDMACWDDKGRLRFLGRRDTQVKIRGARIELGEIEAAIQAHPQIETAVLDVIQYQRAEKEIHHCLRCGLPSNYPDADFDEAGICSDCRAFDEYRDEVVRYFRSPEDLRALLGEARRGGSGQPYDCMVLLSGGKDSTYMLYQLVREYGMRPLVFSLDNGYISEQALENIRRICADLGVDLEMAGTPHMKAIFADSLRRHSNVCDGCYKTIYTLSMNLARRLNIDTIITGLARGQLFETRLADTFRAKCFDPRTIDSWIMDARKAYHQIEDATTQLLDVRIFADDAVFDEIQFVDFYRYVDVDLADVFDYLENQTVWKHPTDTGRSTNCLINDVGIYIHNIERGYHNYALPYSWDVRLGHKTREEAMHELDDELNLGQVRRILAEIGYDENEKMAHLSEKRLAAYYVADGSLPSSDLRVFLAGKLPDFMIPSTFTQLDSLPISANGKIDRRALPDPGQFRPDLETQYAAPTNNREAALTKIWTDIFRLPEIGIYDNFFDLGGDSIISIQIVARARQIGLQFAPRDIFEHQTIAELALVASEAFTTAEQGIVTGIVPLTPIQKWFFEQDFAEPDYWNQSLWLQLPPDVEFASLSKAFLHLFDQHDALRLHFSQTGNGWQQMMSASGGGASLQFVNLSSLTPGQQDDLMEAAAFELEAGLDIENGPLIQAAFFQFGHGQPPRLFITAHHLAVDGVSWGPLLEDMETAYEQILHNRAVALPPKSSSFKEWAGRLVTLSQSDRITASAEFWRSAYDGRPLFRQHGTDQPLEAVQTISVNLDVENTRALLQEVSAAYNTTINEVLLTAIALAFKGSTDREKLSLILEGHGREEEIAGGIDLTRTVGWFTCHYPVSLDLPGSPDPGNALKSVKEQLRRVPDNGFSYGLLRHLHADSPLAGQAEPDVLFKYIGQFERLLPVSNFYKLLRPLGEGYSPANKRTHALEINAAIQEEALQVEWAFVAQWVEPRIIETMAKTFITSLEKIIAHCRSVAGTEPTRSDFDLLDLDDDQFDRLADILESLGD